LSGCEELGKPSFITVKVRCDVIVRARNGSIQHNVPDAMVLIEIIKTGGKKVSEQVETDTYGQSKYIEEDFKLYRKQLITCKANLYLESLVENFSGYTFNSAEETILWNDIYGPNEFGNYVTKSISLYIVGFKN
jgi:hypothetical protein